MRAPIAPRLSGPCRTLRNRRGNAAVEFALVAPLLTLILTAIIQFGLTILTQFTVQEAVLDGANYASHNSWNASSIQSAVTSSSSTIPLANVTVSRFCGCPVASAITTVAQCDQDTANPGTCPATCTTTKCSDGIVTRQYVSISASIPAPGVAKRLFGLPATVGSTMTTKLP